MKVNIVALGFLAASAVAVPLSSNNVDEPAKPTEIQTKEKKTLPTADGLPDVPEACVMPSGCVHGKTSLPPPTVPTVTKSPPHKTKAPVSSQTLW
ncbi:hypothetical protein Daus18300_006749 [Diaporthe australafricana]|uniref:Uncharacterized protein n=1 Tax=Diaporthe australafricana TaxID=127596 RepID=A0ABR3WS70_9PEZI